MTYLDIGAQFADAPSGKLAGEQSAQDHHVLVVDDDHTIRDAIVSFFG